MAEDHPFTIAIKSRVELARRYRWGWTIYESGKRRDRSTKSFATTLEAQADGDRVMQKLIATWRIGK